MFYPSKRRNLELVAGNVPVSPGVQGATATQDRVVLVLKSNDMIFGHLFAHTRRVLNTQV